MSLLDALLLDPYPFECFVAYRVDSIAGSGTIDDASNIIRQMDSKTDIYHTGITVRNAEKNPADGNVEGSPIDN